MTKSEFRIPKSEGRSTTLLSRPRNGGRKNVRTATESPNAADEVRVSQTLSSRLTDTLSLGRGQGEGSTQVQCGSHPQVKNLNQDLTSFRRCVADVVEGFGDQLLMRLSKAAANNHDVDDGQGDGCGGKDGTEGPVNDEAPAREMPLEEGPAPRQHSGSERQAQHAKPSSQRVSGILHRES